MGRIKNWKKIQRTTFGEAGRPTTSWKNMVTGELVYVEARSTKGDNVVKYDQVYWTVSSRNAPTVEAIPPKDFDTRKEAEQYAVEWMRSHSREGREQGMGPQQRISKKLLRRIERVPLKSAQRDMVAQFKNQSVDIASRGNVAGGAEALTFAEQLRLLFQMRNLRNKVVPQNLELARQLNEEMDDILRSFKQAGIPYHPAFGNRRDWEVL